MGITFGWVIVWKRSWTLCEIWNSRVGWKRRTWRAAGEGKAAAQGTAEIKSQKENWKNSVKQKSTLRQSLTSELLRNTVWVTLHLLYLMHYCHQYVNQLAVVQATRSIRRGANSCSVEERDRALSLARIYRDMTETSQSEKRIMKSKLEKKIETVRDFWRNKLVEGTSRSGRMLRAALKNKKKCTICFSHFL